MKKHPILDTSAHLRWKDFLAIEKKSFLKILNFLINARATGKIIYPAQHEIFNCFRITQLNNIKVVIMGQDPYYKPHQAHGLAFSVPVGIKIPPSLINIYKELSNDNVEFNFPTHGCLESWAQQGVMLLNTVLTVEKDRPYSHADLGWEKFTDKVIYVINKYCKNVAFLLWGKNAQSKAHFIDKKRHLILQASHPSPLSATRGFFGCRHFSRTNIWLQKCGIQPIDWTPHLKQ
ncbi:MAG: uracil-DNA glycosylase [Candidatus Dasytiphilus stammeri]